eukprot:4297458-Prymnesium_polylepis.1
MGLCRRQTLLPLWPSGQGARVKAESSWIWTAQRTRWGGGWGRGFRFPSRSRSRSRSRFGLVQGTGGDGRRYRFVEVSTVWSFCAVAVTS